MSHSMASAACCGPWRGWKPTESATGVVAATNRPGHGGSSSRIRRSNQLMMPLSAMALVAFLSAIWALVSHAEPVERCQLTGHGRPVGPRVASVHYAPVTWTTPTPSRGER